MYTSYLPSSLNPSALQGAGKLAIPKGNRPDAKPFWNDEIEDACKRRDEARKEAHLSESDDNAKEFRLLRRGADTIIKTSKEDSWKAFSSELDLKREPSKVWSVIGALDDKNNSKRPGTSLHYIIDKTTGNETTANTDSEKANLLIKTYYQNGKLIKNKINDRPVIKEERKALRECKTCKGSKTGMCCPYNISELNMALYKTKTEKAPELTQSQMRCSSTPAAKLSAVCPPNTFQQVMAGRNMPQRMEVGGNVTIPKPGKDPADTESFKPSFHHLQTNGKDGPRQISILSRKGRQTISQPGRL